VDAERAAGTLRGELHPRERVEDAEKIAHQD
jgi:hypothetical protein